MSEGTREPAAVPVPRREGPPSRWEAVEEKEDKPPRKRKGKIDKTDEQFEELFFSMTGKQLAELLGVSVPTIQNKARELGLRCQS